MSLLMMMVVMMTFSMGLRGPEIGIKKSLKNMSFDNNNKNNRVEKTLLTNKHVDCEMTNVTMILT